MGFFCFFFFTFWEYEVHIVKEKYRPQKSFWVGFVGQWLGQPHLSLSCLSPPPVLLGFPADAHNGKVTNDSSSTWILVFHAVDPDGSFGS